MAASNGPPKTQELEMQVGQASQSEPVHVVFTTPGAYAEHLAATRSRCIMKVVDKSTLDCPKVSTLRSISGQSVPAGVQTTPVSLQSFAADVIKYKRAMAEGHAFADKMTGCRNRPLLSYGRVNTIFSKPEADQNGQGAASPSISLISTVAKSADGGSESFASPSGSAQNSQVSSPPQRNPLDCPEHHDQVKNKLLNALGKLEDAVDKMVHHREGASVAESKPCAPAGTMEVEEAKMGDADDQQKVRSDSSKPSVHEQVDDGSNGGQTRPLVKRMASYPQSAPSLRPLFSSEASPQAATPLRNVLGPYVVRQANSARFSSFASSPRDIHKATSHSVRYSSSAPSSPVIHKAVGTARMSQSFPVIHEVTGRGNTAEFETPPAVTRRVSMPELSTNLEGLESSSSLSSLFCSGY